MSRVTTFHSPLGKISAGFIGDSLCLLEIGKADTDRMSNSNAAMKKLSAELAAYFRDKQFQFTINLQPYGTDFQQGVWSALREIPAGGTLSYGQLAEKLHSSPRAVGNACRANPIPIIIPCHRVVGKNGIGGYDGKTSGRRLDIKRWLLHHEGINIA